MTLFQQYRVWLRRASAGAKASASVAGIIAVSLVAWLVTPITSHSSAAAGSSSLTSGPAGTQTSSGQPQPTTGGNVVPGRTAIPSGVTGGTTGNTSGGTSISTTGTSSTGGQGATTGSTGPTPGGGGKCAPGTDQGVTPTQVHVAIGLLDVPGFASAYNIPSPAQQQKYYDLFIADANKNGGFACRKLVPTYWTINLLDSTALQQACTNIIASKPFAYIDDGVYKGNSARECFPVGKIPFFGLGAAAKAEFTKFYPYFFQSLTFETGYHNTFEAFKKYGMYSPANGFKKEGLLYRDCDPNTEPGTIAAMHQAGLSGIVEYDIGCPTGADNPSDLQQAVLKFQAAGVTNLAAQDFAQDFTNFTKIAQQQGFKPHYGMSDYGYVATAGPTSQVPPDPNNLDGAVVLSPADYGYESSGLPERASTKRCDKILVAGGQPPVYQTGLGYGGTICNQIQLFQAAINYAPSVQRTELAPGLRIKRYLEYSWPNTLADFDYEAANVPAGSVYWRRLEFYKSCTCWKMLDVKMQAPLP